MNSRFRERTFELVYDYMLGYRQIDLWELGADGSSGQSPGIYCGFINSDKAAMLSAVSLFTGAGGMDIGFRRAGVDVIFANDVNPDACGTYAENHRGDVVCGDLNRHLPALKRFRNVDLLIGGPPCQGFSVAGRMDPNDTRSKLIWTFFDAVALVRPKMFVCENVKALAKLSRWGDVRSEMFTRARGLGYSTFAVVLNSADFGVPQARERMFFIGCRTGIDISGCSPLLRGYAEPRASVRNVLLALGPAGGQGNARICKARVTTAKKPVLRNSPYAGMLFNGQGRPINPDGLCSTLPASMGGNRTPIIDENHLYRNKPSWVEHYHGHLRKGGLPFPNTEVPTSLRRLTVDEALRIQTFPDNYRFHGRQSSVYTQIGNAVPPNLAYAVARFAVNTLEGNYDLPSVSRQHQEKLSVEFEYA